MIFASLINNVEEKYMLVKSLIAFLTFNLASLSLASGYSYVCKATNPDEDDGLVRIAFSARFDQAKVTNKEGESSMILRDTTYHPQSDKGSARYSGDLRILGEGIDGYNLTIIANSFLMKQAKIGYLKVQARGEGFFSRSYICNKLCNK
jgi:hypothetical protein